MKRILVHVVLVIQFFVIFFMILFDQSVSHKVRKLFINSKNMMAPYNAEILKPKPPDLRSIPPDILEDLQNRLPNLPVLSSLSVKNMDSEEFASKCSIYPDILDIEYSNKYWQMFRSENAIFYLYSAILGN